MIEKTIGTKHIINDSMYLLHITGKVYPICLPKNIELVFFHLKFYELQIFLIMLTLVLLHKLFFS